jgi:hypothetical protein
MQGYKGTGRLFYRRPVFCFRYLLFAGTPEGDSGALYPLQQGVPSIVRADARFVRCSLVCTYVFTSHGLNNLNDRAAARFEIESRHLIQRLYFVIFTRSVTRTSIGTAGFMTEK